MLIGTGLTLKAQIPPDSIVQSNTDLPGNNVDSVPQDSIPGDKLVPFHKAASDTAKLKTPGLNDRPNCLYNIKPAIDIPISALALAGTFVGFNLINKKPPTDTNIILNLDPEKDIPLAINRVAIHNYDPNAAHISDYFLYGGFVYGFTLLLDHDIRQDALKIGLLYLETMAITGASYSLVAGSIDKLRPYAYNTDSFLVEGQKVPEVPLSKKANTGAVNSFYAGHPSVPAASALFVASVYSTYHPHSSFRFVLYGIAIAATGTTTYLRYKAGAHFPTDLFVGVALGSTYGLLIPHLHRCKDGSGLSIAPLTGQVKGVNMTYTF